MKKFRKLLFFAAITALLTCLLCVALNAETVSGKCGAEGDGSNLTWSLDTETGVLKLRGKGAMEGYSPGDTPWYNYRLSIKTAKIGDGVTRIGDWAFYNCSSLTSIEIPSSVISIGDHAFYDCSSLTSIEIPDGVTSIGGDAFYGCSNLTSIEIPSSVTSIGKSAFGGCSSLTSINVDEENKSYKLIDGVLFTKDQKTLISYPAKKEGTAYTIPDSVTSIGDRAFSYCSSLTSIEIPDSVTSIGDYAFYYCRSLTSIEIPSSVTSIGGSAFFYCSKLKYNEYDNAVYLGNAENPYHALIEAKNIFITDCTINDSTKVIGDNAFRYCFSLTSITIPDSVTRIGNQAFFDCSSLTSIEIPDGVTSIGGDAFYGCSNLTSIEIPSSVTSIGDYAFFDCSSLTSIEIPSSVTSIGDSAFSGCSKLKYNEYDNAVYLGNAENPYVALIEAKNTSITDCTINDSTKVIGGGAFYNCSSLTSIEIPSSVTSIGDSAFSWCISLTSIKIFSDTVEIYDSSYTIFSSATIYGYKGSTAETYAKKYNRKFIPLKCDEHNFGDNYKHDDINHWLECADCGEKKDEAAHTFRQRFDKTHHWNECSCGFIKDKSEHMLDEEGKCTECRFGRVMLGDLNGDGKISAIDLTLMRKYIAGYKVDMIEAAADLNGDGRITAIDLTMLRKYIAGLITEF